MKISIGSDHRGVTLKSQVIESFPNHDWSDVGVGGMDRVDYPDYARLVCEKILNGDGERGVLICGTGVGMAMAANRHPGIYAAVCWSVEVARSAREHDGCNLLVFASDFTGEREARAIFSAWIETRFAGGRYQKRLDMIDT